MNKKQLEITMYALLELRGVYDEHPEDVKTIEYVMGLLDSYIPDDEPSVTSSDNIQHNL